MNAFCQNSLLVFLAATAGVSALALQDDRKPIPGVQTKPASADVIAEKWRELGTPGAAHEVLDGRAGKWNVEVKMFEPGTTASSSTPAQTTTGKSEAKWVLDGRFVQENVTGEWMGQSFQGLGMIGYDNLKQKYVSSWCDNLSTTLMTAEGTYDAATKTFTFTGECPDPMSGKFSRFRSVEKQVDPNRWSMQTFKVGPDGREYLAGEFQYTRS